MTCRRSRAVDTRGNSYDRRVRKTWLLSAAAGFGGNGEKVPCWEPQCGTMVDYERLYVDRIIPGEQGGSYRRDNIKPHCGPCSHRQGQRRTTEIMVARREVDLYGPDDLCRECGAHYLGRHAEGCATPGL